jgi:hypothetical protein
LYPSVAAGKGLNQGGRVGRYMYNAGLNQDLGRKFVMRPLGRKRRHGKLILKWILGDVNWTELAQISVSYEL